MREGGESRRSRQGTGPAQERGTCRNEEGHRGIEGWKKNSANVDDLLGGEVVPNCRV